MYEVIKQRSVEACFVTLSQPYFQTTMTIFRLLSKSKKEVPWEVVGSTVVEPVPMHEDEDGAYLECSVIVHCSDHPPDLDISHIANEDMIRTYSFDITKSKHFRNAIVFARQMMLQDLARTSYNMLLTEG